MSMPVRLSDELVKKAGVYAKVYSRSLPKQIEHWARIGRIAEDNPDLPYEMIQNILHGLEEEQNGELTELTFTPKK